MVATLETIPDHAPPALRQWLESLPRSRDWYFAMTDAACGVMRIDASTQSGCVVEVFARPSGPAHARPVLEDLESTARQRDCRGMIWSTNDSPMVSRIRPVLTGLGWDAGCHLRCFGFEFARIATAPWVQNCRDARDCEIVPWTALSAAQRARIEATDLSPFAQERYLEPACSIALVRRGEVAGWSISTRESVEAVYIASVFVAEDLRAHGAGARLIAETLRRGAAAGIRSASFEVEPHRHAMLRFAERHLLPYVSTDLNIYRTWKNLS